MRRMRCAWSVVDEKGPVGSNRLLVVDILDHFVGERVVEGVVSLAAFGNLHLDWSRIAEERRLPLVGLAANEAIEVVKTLKSRPTVQWTGEAGLQSVIWWFLPKYSVV